MVIGIELHVSVQYGVSKVDRIVAAFCSPLLPNLSPFVQQIKLGDQKATGEHDDAAEEEADDGCDHGLQIGAEPGQAGRHLGRSSVVQ
jgi:hypothetical protein